MLTFIAKYKWRLVVGLVLIVTFAYFPLRARAPQSSCGTLSTTIVASPDGRWKALTTEGFCEFGYAFLSQALYTVSLISTSDSATHEDVFAIDDDGPKSKPSVSWTSPSALKITTLKPIYMNLQKASYNGITVSYNFVRP